MLVGAAGISAVKTVKDPSFFGIRYAGAVVLHGQGDFFPTVCQAQFHGGARGGVVKRIVEQDCQQLLYTVRVRLYGRNAVLRQGQCTVVVSGLPVMFPCLGASGKLDIFSQHLF